MSRSRRISPSEGQSSRMAIISNLPVDDSKLRDQWPRKFEFLLALTAYNVNLHCVWNFPSYCFKHGGTAFFVPYILTMILCGIPMYMLEMMLGQYGGAGVVANWQCIPIFRGIGYASAFINFTVAIYYSVYASWTLYYLAASFRPQLLWRDCDPHNRWITTSCKLTPYNNCTQTENYTVCQTNTNDSMIHYQYGISPRSLRLTNREWLFKYNETFNSTTNWTGSDWIYARNETIEYQRDAWTVYFYNSTNESNSDWRLPAHDYFENEVIHAPNSFIEMRPEIGLGYELILCLLFICILILLCLLRGAKSIGKSAAIMVVLSYTFLIVVLIRTIFSSKGAGLGLVSYLYPDWTRLTDFHIWGDASLLAFFTVFPSWGAIANLASHNSPETKFREDAVISVLGSAVSNVLYGFTITMLVGVLAEAVGVSPLAFITTGPNLIFVAVAQGLSQLPLAPIWSSFFYFSVLNVIMGTLILLVQTVSESVTRSCVSSQSAMYWRPLFAAAVCMAVFLIGIGLLTKVGIHVTYIFEHYCNWWNSIVLALIELIVLLCISHRFDKAYQLCANPTCNRFSRFLLILWQVIGGLVMISMLVYVFYPYVPIVLDLGSFKYPTWAEAVGWTLTVIPLAFVPILMIKAIVRADGHGLQKLRNSVKPDPEWVQRQDDQNPALNKRFAEDIEIAVGSGPIHVRRGSVALVQSLPPPEPRSPIVEGFAAGGGAGGIEMAPPPGTPVPYTMNTMMVSPPAPPPPEPAPRRPARIGATEPGLKPGKINRGTQMSRDIAIQTGGEDGDGAFVEYPEHYDHPEFMGIGRVDGKRHKKRKDKHHHKKRDKKDRHHHEEVQQQPNELLDDENDDGAANLPTPPPVPKPTAPYEENNEGEEELHSELHQVYRVS